MRKRWPWILLAAATVVALFTLSTWLLASGGRPAVPAGPPATMPTPSPNSPADALATPSTPSMGPVTSATTTSVDPYQGLTGSDSSWSIPQHTIVLEVSAGSAQPTRVGWMVPTSKHGVSGYATYTGSSWSHAATAYGPPGYARLWVWSGPSGAPITCRILVDGKVSDTKTTQGPYGAVMCQA